MKKTMIWKMHVPHDVGMGDEPDTLNVRLSVGGIQVGAYPILLFPGQTLGVQVRPSSPQGSFVDVWISESPQEPAAPTPSAADEAP